jgi:hypothetical protein
MAAAPKDFGAAVFYLPKTPKEMLAGLRNPNCNSPAIVAGGNAIPLARTEHETAVVAAGADRGGCAHGYGLDCRGSAAG